MADPYADLGGEDEESAYRDLGATLEARRDWGDAANSGASVVQEPPGTESIAAEPYGPPENPRPVGAGEALVRAYLSGFEKQGADENTGALAAALYGGNGTTGEIYRRARDRVRDENANAEEQWPKLSMGANMLGDMSSDWVLNRLGVPVTSQAYQVGSGALTGLLNSDADLTQPTPESVMQAGEEATLGGAAAYAIPMVGRYAGQKIAPYASRAAGALSDWWGGTAASDWLENLARERALKASGYIQKDFARGAPKRERLINGAQELLDEPGLIGPFSSKADIATRLEPLVDREGRNIGRALDAADDAALSGDWAGRPFNPNAFAADAARLRGAGEWRGGPFNPYAFIADARERVVAPFTENPSLRTAGEGVSDWLDSLDTTASHRLPSRGEPFTFRRANEYKGDLQDMVFNTRGDVKPTVNARAQNELQRLFTQSIDQQAEPLLGPQQLAEFQRSRRLYGTFKDAFDKATQGANRDLGNNALGLKDMQAAQLAAEAAKESGGIIGPAVALVSKVARGRGDSFAARTADSLAQAQWLDTLASTQPEVLGQWGQYLSAAAARSPEALGQMHNNLSETEPDYQRRMRLLGGQQE